VYPSHHSLYTTTTLTFTPPQLHKIIRSAILSTDMKYHMDFLNRFTAYLDQHGEDPRGFDADGRLLMMQMALKVRIPTASYRWVYLYLPILKGR
jgi:hypothetical protein